MDELNYLVLYADGGFGVMPIGDDSDDQIFQKLMQVFTTTQGYFYDNYNSETIRCFTPDDVARVVEKNDVTRAFGSSLNGRGFELFACWHERDRELHEAGVYEQNHFLAGNRFTVYGPIVLRAQVGCVLCAVEPESDPMELPTSNALYVGELIVKSKAESMDTLFGAQ